MPQKRSNVTVGLYILALIAAVTLASIIFIWR